MSRMNPVAMLQAVSLREKLQEVAVCYPKQVGKPCGSVANCWVVWKVAGGVSQFP